MNKIFTTQDLPWKTASIILAFLLWMFVINTQNPIQPQEVSGIRISILGLDKLENMGYEVTNKEEILNQNFKVVINGPRLETDTLVKNPQLITATLDLSVYMNNLDKDSISELAVYSIRVNSDSNVVSVKDKKPQVNKVIIEKRDSKEQRVTYEIEEGFNKKYTLIGDEKPSISPEKITITGSKTDIDKVSEAKVLITAEDFSEDQLVNKLPIILLDADGNEIKGLEMSSATAEVKLPIGSEKTVPLVVKLKGQIREGYELINTMMSPNEVTLIGRAQALEKIKEITLQPIDLSQITKTDLIQVDMILPEGVITLGDTKVSVSVEVVEENTLIYAIPMEELNLTIEGLDEALVCEIVTPSINVILSAVPSKLVAYKTSDIRATLDLSQYQAGEYTVPLTIIPPEGARVVNSPLDVNVRLIAEGPPEEIPPGDDQLTEEIPSVDENNGQHHEEETTP